MIVATAGHIDHGKTTLVKALTGVDADRLPEEKRRGMTIDLGFAYLSTDDAQPIGFIDVPGHERLIHNMLCGVTGIDFALLVVAADDGPMPQTREHLAILDILGIARGAVALTKVDRVERARAAEVGAAIRSMLADTSLAAAPLFEVSATTGAGVEALLNHLRSVARGWTAPEPAGNFRLAIDRAFTVAGAGLVVTGTVFSGCIRQGDEARLLASDARVRVRGIHSQNRPAQIGRAGQRCALNIAGTGLAKDRIARGEWVVSGSVPPPSRRLDVRLRIAAIDRRFDHWTSVHVHLGAAETTGRVALLEARALEPGEAGLAQLYLDQPIGAVSGDRFVIRDQPAQRTLGGGRVVDVFPPVRGRSKPERLAALAAMSEDDVRTALASLLAVSPTGIDFGRFGANRNLTSADSKILQDAVPMRTVAAGSTVLGLAPDAWSRLKEAALASLATWHEAEPESPGLAEARLFAARPARIAPGLSAAMAADLARDGRVLRDGALVRLPTHTRTMTAVDAALWRRIEPLLASGGRAPPALADLALTLQEDSTKLERMLVRAARHGLVVRVGKTRFLLPSALRELGEIAEAVARTGPLTAAGYRDRAGIGRNLAIEVLEHFDRIKFTHRQGDVRKVLKPAAQAFGPAP
jgi:selenocysteine-specific elongation factor